MRHHVLKPTRPFWPVLLVFLASILFTLCFWTILPPQFGINENSDYTSFYEPVARNILAGHGFITSHGFPAVRYPPGYPLLLAGIFGVSHLLNIPEATVLSAFILLCMGLASVFVFMLARSIWGPLPALVSSLLWMTYPFALWLTKQPTNSEIPFLAVFYGGFCLFWYALLRKSRAWPLYFLSGLLAGFTMLIRPIAVGIVMVMSIILWVMGREMTARFRLFLVAMLLLGNFVAIVPWATWVYATTGRAVRLSTGGAPAMRAGLTFALTHNSKNALQSIRVPQDVTALMQDFLVRSGEMQSLSGIVSVLTETWRTQPLTTAKLYALKTARSWYGTYSGRFETPIMLIQTVYLALALWGSIAAWKRGGIAKQLSMSVWVIVLYFWGITVLTLSILRYMVPAMAFLFVLIPIIPDTKEHNHLSGNLQFISV